MIDKNIELRAIELRAIELRAIELLAPAGSFETFLAVLAAGADAVYVGGNSFGARAYANNFSEEELLAAIDYAHLHHRKLYLTVNTLFKEKELNEQLYSYLLPYYKQGLDAVIVQDIGAFKFIREHFPDLEIHTSTQMTITNRYGAELMKELGASRIVTAREMSFDEIKDISENVEIEIESFIHGALCYCFSGQCLLSSMIGGRSGNRGRCAQPCRLPYEAYNSDEKRMSNPKKPYILSPKDLCTIDFIPQLVNAGITSFKIEGRMKQAEYAAGVVSIYRKYIDLYLEQGEKGYKVSREDAKKLLDLGNRSGFTDGYYTRKNGADMITFEQPSHKKGNESLQDTIRKQYLDTKIKEKIKGNLRLTQDLPAKIEVSFQDKTIAVTGDIVQSALKQPLLREKVEESLKKTGNTPFEFEKLQVEMDESVFMPVKALNNLRREALEQLEAAVLSDYRREEPQIWNGKELKNQRTSEQSYLITVSIENRNQLLPVLRSPIVTDIYLDSSCYGRKSFLNDLKTDCELIRKSGKKAYFILPAVFRKRTSDFYQTLVSEFEKLSLDGFVVKNYDALQFVRKYLTGFSVIFDQNLYTYNNQAILELENYQPLRLTAPFELNKKELLHRDNHKSELVIYGKLPLMVSAQCVVCNTMGCQKKTGISYIKDRYDKKFAVKNDCEECYNVIYNSLPLLLFGQAEELKRMHFTAYRLSFTTEEEKEVQKVLQLCENIFVPEDGKDLKMKDFYSGDFTYGHYKRGVE